METNAGQDRVENGRSTGRGWSRWAMIGGLAAAVVGGAGLSGAFSQEPARLESRDGGPRLMQAHWGGGRFAERRIDSVLDAIGATPEQEKRLWEIVDAGRSDIWPMARAFRGTREDFAELLGAPTIDREAVEKLRSERVAAMDQLSQRLTQALLDAAEVLTPEQRAELLEHFEERGRHRRW